MLLSLAIDSFQLEPPHNDSSSLVARRLIYSPRPKVVKDRTTSPIMASPAAQANGTTTPPVESKPTAAPDIPATSQSDDGSARRPRDARLIHLILSSLGIHSYQERVPLQLLDFAYRYTSSVLSDALRLSAEGYASAPGQSSNRRDAANDGSNITVNALRQAIASRQDYQFQGPLPKEFMLEQAVERNRVQLPKIEKAWGVQLPPEKYCLTGTGWRMEDAWESEDEDEDGKGDGEAPKRVTNGEDAKMGGTEGATEAEDEDVGTFEDVFGGGNEDSTMGDA